METADSAAEPDPRIGAVLGGRYRVVERLAAGGMGVVYRGERIELGRAVAIKFLHAWAASSADAVKRFEIEARAMGRLQSPVCVSVIDFGLYEGAPYLVMELVSGDTLREVIKRGPVPMRRTLGIMRQVLSGLAHAHARDIIHRDIKPENIVLTEVPGFDAEVRILDFGVAKLRDSASQLTAGFAIGTPSHMAPEQTTGGGIDARTDLYAAGVVLFQLLTGRPPFVASSSLLMIRMHCEEPPPTLAAAAPGLRFSAEMEALVQKTLAKQPAQRFQTAAELAAALEATPEAGERSPSLPSVPPPAPVPGPPPAPVPGPPPALQPTAVDSRSLPTVASAVSPRRSRRRLLIIAGAGAGVLVLGLILVLALRGGGQGNRAGDQPSAAPGASAEPEPDIQIDESAGSASTVPGLDELARLGRRDPFSATARLKKLRAAYPDAPEIPYLMGNIYCEREMWPDCFEAYHAALPRYREDPVLIRNAIRSFNSDRQHGRGMTFVERELGAPALAALQATAADPRTPGHVRKRAAEVAQRLAQD